MNEISNLRRPSVPCAAGFALGSVLAYLFADVRFLFVFPAAAAALLRKKRLLLLFFGFLSFGILAMSYQTYVFEKDPILGFDGKETEISGMVTASQSRKDNAVIDVKTGSRSCVRLTVYDASASDFPRGTGIEGTAEYSLPAGRTNPGCFDYRLFLKSRGIVMTASAPASMISDTGTVSVWRKHLYDLTSGFESKMKQYMSEKHVSLLRGMLFGDKSGIDEETYDSFQRNGTAHILAVSGLHVGIVYGLFSFIFRGKRKISINIIIFLLLMIYAALSGFTASVMRASIMITLHIISKIIHKRYDLTSAACVSSLALMMQNPFVLFSSGFQLSFLAVLSLGQLMPLFKNMTGHETLRSLFLPGILLQAGMSVYTIWCFNSFSPLSFLFNIPVIFFAGIIVPSGVVSIAATSFFSFLARPAASFLSVCLTILEKTNSFLYMEGKTSFDMCSPPLWVLLFFYGFFFLFTSEAFRIWFLRRKMTLISLGIAAVFITALPISVLADSSMRGVSVMFIDVGQGSSIFVKSPDGRAVLIDGGGRRNSNIARSVLRPVLLKNGIRHIDTAIATHKDMDHYKGLTELKELGMVSQLITNDSGFRQGSTIVSESEKGHVFKIQALAPLDAAAASFGSQIPGGSASTTESNESSLVMKITFDDFSVLATGDIGKDTEKKLTASGQDLRSTILAVPHHGSKNSSSEEFINAVSPSLAVIQVGKNNYGHPSPQTLSAYRNAGIPVLRTDKHGAAGIWITVNGPKMETVCGSM